jgi:DNA-binding XRE family transcriptional regulator
VTVVGLHNQIKQDKTPSVVNIYSCHTHSFGYLIPWSYIRQKETILGMAKPSPTHAGDQLLVSLGAAIRSSRLELGLSQEALALATELDRSYVGGIERGEHNIGLISLGKICTALHKKPSDILKSSGN